MKVLVAGPPNIYHPITEYIYQGFTANNIDADYLCFIYPYNKNNNYLLRKLDQLKLYDLIKAPLNKYYLNRDYYYKINARLLANKLAQKKYDMVFFYKAGNSVRADDLSDLKTKHNILLYSWYMDDPLLFWGEKLQVNNNIVEIIKILDKVFLYDKYLIEGIRNRLNSNTYYLPIGYNPEIYHKIEAEKENDVSFIGSYSEERYRYLHSLRQHHLIIAGPGDWGELENFKKYEVASPQQSNVIFNRTWLNYNLHLNQTVTGANLRVFEVTGSGNLLLTDYRRDLEDLFDIDKEIICYQTEEELKEKVQYYLNRPEKMIEIANTGYYRAKKNHTFYHRIKRVLTEYS